LVLVPFTVLGQASAQQSPAAAEKPREVPAVPAAPDRLIVQFTEDATSEEKDRARAKFKIKKQDQLPLIGAEIVSVPAGTDVHEVASRLSADPAVDYAEPDYLITLDSHGAATPNDPRWTDLWGLHNTGQSGFASNGTPQLGVADTDVDAPEAWATSEGGGVVVAVIDSGTDIAHPDLIDAIWTNPGETPGNGVDDDANGFIDDVNGWDFCNNNATVFDGVASGGIKGDEHGSHVSGTIAATLNNSAGIAGVAPEAAIMPLKFLGRPEAARLASPTPACGFISEAVAAINYARTMGVTVSNNSWGNVGTASIALRNAIAASGQTFIASAGNGGSDGVGDDNDVAPYYPAAFDLPNILSVAALDNQGSLARFSNFGAVSVDVGAPGVKIMSTLPGNTYGYYDGTSMAAPHVAGVAALVASANPHLSPVEVVRSITSSAVPLMSLAGKTTTGGMANAAGALDVAGRFGEYHALTPARIMDTRSALGGHPGRIASSEAPVSLQVTGAGGVPAGATAVVLNVTVTEPSTNSYLLAYPSDAPYPGVSNLNFSAGQTIPNTVITKVGPDGTIKLAHYAGAAHVIVDVQGYYTKLSTAGSRYSPLAPSRILDTRNGTGGLGKVNGALPPPNVQITGRGGVPAGATAVVMNVTVTEPTDGPGYLSLYPADAPTPTVSNLNFVAGQTIANSVVTKLSPSGQVALLNSTGSSHVIFDVEGYYAAGPGGARFVPLAPSRILDTRSSGKVVGGSPPSVPVWARAGVPDGASGVVMNVTVTEPTGVGYVSVYPADQAAPTVSNVNFIPGETIPNTVVTKLGSNGAVKIGTNPGNQTHVIFDVQGYYLPG